MLGLQHTSGIMRRGYDYMNRALISIEPDTNISNDFLPIKQNEKYDPFYDPTWNSSDAIYLSKHICFNPIKLRYEWQVLEQNNANKHYFRNYDLNDIWYESSTSSPNAVEFKFIKMQNKQVILFDSSRSMYARIDNDKLYIGTNGINDVNIFLYNGKWTIKP